MTRLAILDAWSGVSGDMWVGAMLDCGVPLAALEEAIGSLGLPGTSLQADSVRRGGLAGTRFRVLCEGRDADAHDHGPSGHAHRGLADIEAIVARGRLPEPVRANCLAVYRAIAEVEAEAHGVAIADVHFHEVGAIDTIVDVVAACLATHLLGVDRLVANGIVTGSGTVRTAHGILPVPAPATAALLRGIPVTQGGLDGERTTPTGAALLAVLASGYDEAVSLVPEAVGYGAGSREDPHCPNLLRVTVGTAGASAAPSVVELSCQVDTASGELVGWLVDEALSRGALDAFVTPIQMKKGRPGLLVTVLADQTRELALRDLLLEESTSLGVRSRRLQRSVLERWQETRDTALGAVTFKVARLPSGRVIARPEDDEVRRLCRQEGLGRAEVLRRLQPDEK